MVKNWPANAGDIRNRFDRGQEDPLDEGMATHSTILPGEFHGRRSLAGYNSQGHKELDMTETA